MEKNEIFMGNGKENERLNFVKHGIECVWDITISAYSFLGIKNAEFRLQRNVVSVYQKQR